MAIQPSDEPDGYLVDLTSQVKAALAALPVFTVGGIKDPVLAEEIVASGKADMVAMTRAQIADPDFATKVEEGREDEITHCIRGNQGCIGRVFKGLAISCTVNPAAGREAQAGQRWPPADPPARWLVAGGGPAGMKAAETLAKRGHSVTLVEKETEPRRPGQPHPAGRPDATSSAWITRDLETQLRKAGRRDPARHGGDD